MADQYCYLTVHKKECALYIFQQHNLTEKQYYERFNTDVDVGVSIHTLRKYHFLM